MPTKKGEGEGEGLELASKQPDHALPAPPSVFQDRVAAIVGDSRATQRETESAVLERRYATSMAMSWMVLFAGYSCL